MAEGSVVSRGLHGGHRRGVETGSDGEESMIGHGPKNVPVRIQKALMKCFLACTVICVISPVNCGCSHGRRHLQLMSEKVGLRMR